MVKIGQRDDLLKISKIFKLNFTFLKEVLNASRCLPAYHREIDFSCEFTAARRCLNESIKRQQIWQQVIKISI